jgi:hypothetical protein
MSKNVYQKLQLARLLLQEKKLNKSGKNKFAGYEYFELQDFLPAVQTIFSDTGLCPVFRVFDDRATLTIVNVDNPEDYLVFNAPMASAELKGCHPVQNLGASISYLRRYLYVNALEIVEHDALDATTGRDAAPAQAPKPVAKPAPAPAPKQAPAQTDSGAQVVKATELPQQEWEIKVSGDSGSADWMGLVETSADTLLGLATSADDVMTIYKRNKQLFEEVKAQDAVFFKDLMDKFTATKKKFTEAV